MVENDIIDFIAKQKSLQLACIQTYDNKKNEQVDAKLNSPLISYTPFYYHQENNLFYIFISKLAEHGKHLPTNDLVSIMLIEDEQGCKNIFARQRLTYSCSVSSVSRNSEQWIKFIEKFKQQFGKMIELLSQFNDFDMYCLKPQNGNFVQGFGKAYRIENGQIIHLDSKNIDSSPKD